MMPAELAARRYIEIWSERDPAARRTLLEACFAENARLVSRRRTFQGRAELDADGRIVVIYTFAGPLADAASAP